MTSMFLVYDLQLYNHITSQDPGFEELIDAAGLMSVEQARGRIKELGEKRDELDLDDKGVCAHVCVCMFMNLYP